ncbi:hypothetical protein BGZ98_005152, partial [Dissophora globulifera]
GDSAGANLCLTSALKLRDDSPHINLPAGQVLISPWVMCPKPVKTSPHDYITTNGLRLFMDAYTQGQTEALTSPYVSPIGAPTLKGMPRMMIFIGGVETLRPSIEDFIQKATADGVDVQYEVKQGKVHDYALIEEVAGAKTVQEATQSIGRFVAQIQERQSIMGKAPKGTFQVVGNYRGRNFDANFHKGSGPANNNNNSNNNSNHNSNRNSNHSSNHNSNNNNNNNTHSYATTTGSSANTAAPTNKNPRSKRNLKEHEENTQYPAKGKARRTVGWDRPHTHPSPDHTTTLSWPDPSINATHVAANSRPSSIIADGSSSNSALTNTVYGRSDPAKPSQQSSAPFSFSFGQPLQLPALSSSNSYSIATVASPSSGSVKSNAILTISDQFDFLNSLPSMKPVVESLATSPTLVEVLDLIDGMRRIVGTTYDATRVGHQLMLLDIISNLNVILKKFDTLLVQIELGTHKHWEGHTESIRKLRTSVWQEEAFYRKMLGLLSTITLDNVQVGYIQTLRAMMGPTWSLIFMDLNTNSSSWEWTQER